MNIKGLVGISIGFIGLTAISGAIVGFRKAIKSRRETKELLERGKEISKETERLIKESEELLGKNPEREKETAEQIMKNVVIYSNGHIGLREDLHREPTDLEAGYIEYLQRVFNYIRDDYYDIFYDSFEGYKMEWPPKEVKEVDDLEVDIDDALRDMGLLN